MRVILALMVMWWIVNLIVSMAEHDTVGIGAGVLYLAAVAFGVFVQGAAAGLLAWIAIGIGVEAVFYLAFHTHVPGFTLAAVLFWSALAILAGNLFRSE